MVLEVESPIYVRTFISGAHLENSLCQASSVDKGTTTKNGLKHIFSKEKSRNLERFLSLEKFESPPPLIDRIEQVVKLSMELGSGGGGQNT